MAGVRGKDVRYGRLLLRAWLLASRDPADPRHCDHRDRFLSRRVGGRAQGRVQKLRRVPMQLVGGFGGAGYDVFARVHHEHAAGDTVLKQT